MKDKIKSIWSNPEGALWLLLIGWWIINLIQAAFTGLADDEAYYYLFSKDLAWGYFDHPPVTALLVRLGSFVGGELGMRLLFTILQPLYIYIFWLVIKPAEYTSKDTLRYVLICAAMPILQLYGFIAVPDGPLMFATAFFLWSFKRFTEKNDWPSTLILGAAMGLLAYSKYHGALVVLFALLPNLYLLKNPRFYLAGLVTLILFIPHLRWQQDHNWVSFAYHLQGRNRDFQWAFVTEYILNLFAIFNPFLFPVAVAAWWKTRSGTAVERAIKVIGAGFILFFLASTIRGYVQPQWEIPATFCVIAMLYGYSTGRERLKKYITRVSVITLILVAFLRVEMIFNPLGIRYQIFDNEASYEKLAELAAGRPIIFDGQYTWAAKYNFYTGGKSFANPTVQKRTSQYELTDMDESFFGRPAVIENRVKWSHEITLPSGNIFRYNTVEKYIPVRKITIETPTIGERLSPGQKISLDLTLTNPYPYDYRFDGDSVSLIAVFRRVSEDPVLVKLSGFTGVLPAGGQLSGRAEFIVPELRTGKKYQFGFTIDNGMGNTWFNSPVEEVIVE